MQAILSQNSGSPFGSLEATCKKRSDADMELLATKVLRVLQDRDETQAKAARAIGVDASQFAKWLKGRGRPTVEQLLSLARHLDVPMDYLADDQMSSPPRVDSSSQITADQRVILQVIEDLGLTRREAIRRLYGPPQVDEDWRPDGKARLVSGGMTGVGSGGPAASPGTQPLR